MTPTDGAVNAPATYQIERHGGTSVAYTKHFPEVRAGVCEYCGILDPNVPSEYQYKLCPHFRGIGTLSCSYCPDHKNPDDVVRNSRVNVHVHPDNPNKLVIVCDSFECSDKHIKRFKVNR
jgi:hypothetical protein